MHGVLSWPALSGTGEGSDVGSCVRIDLGLTNGKAVGSGVGVMVLVPNNVEAVHRLGTQ